MKRRRRTLRLPRKGPRWRRDEEHDDAWLLVLAAIILLLASGWDFWGLIG